MAGVRGPLFGLDASGSIGDAITFSKWKGRAYVRIKATPSNPRSAGQISTRAMMKFLTQNWNAFTDAEKATWDTLAASGNYSPFNAYVKYNMDRWTQFTSPLRTIGDPDNTPATLGTLTPTGGVRQATLSQVITTAADGWGIVVHASLTTGFTPSKTTVVAVALMTATPTVVVVAPLTPGTWFFRTMSFSYDGSQSGIIFEQSAVVTG